MLVSAFKMRYLRITELTELTGHAIWPYPDNLVIQEKKKRIRKIWTKLKNYLLVG